MPAWVLIETIVMYGLAASGLASLVFCVWMWRTYDRHLD